MGERERPTSGRSSSGSDIFSGSSVSIEASAECSDGTEIRATLVEKVFSPFGASTKRIVVYYVLYDWASKVTVFAFNISIPLLITKLGNQEFGTGQGKIVYTYLTSVTYVITALCFLTFTSIIEFGNTKRDALIFCGIASSIALLLFAVCFNAGTIYFALVLALCSRVLFNIGNVAFDALLDGVTEGIRDAHQISSRSFLTGYMGMIVFAVTLIPILYIIYYFIPMSGALRTFVVEGVVPLVSIGLWYLGFVILINFRFPPLVGVGPPFPVDDFTKPPPIVTSAQMQRQFSQNSDFSEKSNVKSGGIIVLPEMGTKLIPDPKPETTAERCCRDYHFGISWTCNMLRYGFVNGTKLQWTNIMELYRYPDLSIFFLSFVFLNGALNSALSVAAIVVADIYNASSTILVACMAVGICTAIGGLFCYKYLHKNKYLQPKTILIINTIILAGMALYLLAGVGSDVSLIVIAAVGGSQVGSVGAFSRSIVSRLIPTEKQSRLFSFYQFSQEATSWIGPLVIASVATSSGGENDQFVFISVMVILGEIAVGLPLLMMINFTRGEDTRDLADRAVSAEAAAARDSEEFRNSIISNFTPFRPNL